MDLVPLFEFSMALDGSERKDGFCRNLHACIGRCTPAREWWALQRMDSSMWNLCNARSCFWSLFFE
jgi:hypothetical protein